MTGEWSNWSSVRRAGFLGSLFGVRIRVDELDGAGDPVVVELFGFRPRVGREGAFVCTGITPRVVSSLAEREQDLDHRLFEAGIDAREPT
jgi:hypothetical protein